MENLRDRLAKPIFLDSLPKGRENWSLQLANKVVGQTVYLETVPVVIVPL